MHTSYARYISLRKIRYTFAIAQVRYDTNLSRSAEHTECISTYRVPTEHIENLARDLYRCQRLMKLAFDCSYHNAFSEILLQIRIEHQNRNSSHHNNGVLYTFADCELVSLLRTHHRICTVLHQYFTQY